METLVVVDEHKNQFYSRRNNSQIIFSSKGFRDITCRAFHSEQGILPTPFQTCFTSIDSSPKTPQSVVTCQEDKMKPLKSRSIPINFNKMKSFDTEFCDSELWAGPTYCNSPPPSSLPIPKFSLREKRSVSFELPNGEVAVGHRPIAKSAPTTPFGSPNSFFLSTDSATKDLRRILHLED